MPRKDGSLRRISMRLHCSQCRRFDMSRIEERLRSLGLMLPPPLTPPAGMVFPFQFVRVVGRRALISGHGPQGADGTLAEPRGKVGRELSVEQGYAAARLTGL